MHRLAPCVLLAAAFAPAQGDANVAELCAQIAPAIKGSLKAGAAVPLPKADVLARIADLAPGKGRCDGAALFRVQHAWPDDDAIEGRLARVPVGDDSGRQVVLIAARDRSCRGGAVLDKQGKLLAQWNAFANQLAGKTLPKLQTAVTAAAAAKVIAAAEQGTDGKAKATAALIDLKRQMVRQGAVAGEILDLLENGKAPAAAQVGAARAAYAALQTRAADLAPTLGSGSKEYGELVKRALAALDGVAGDDTAAKRKERHKQLNGACRDCHSLHGDKIDGDFEDFAANERLRLGLGERVFLVGYDVLADGVPDGPDRADAQRLADACYRAALLLDQSMQ
jgi:hypothetical protein